MRPILASRGPFDSSGLPRDYEIGGGPWRGPSIWGVKKKKISELSQRGSDARRPDNLRRQVNMNIRRIRELEEENSRLENMGAEMPEAEKLTQSPISSNPKKRKIRFD